jgi:hypothetical protein
MSDVEYLGPDGGRLALAFAAGCLACFTFLSLAGGFIWKLIGKTRVDRITELEVALKEEREHCRAMEARLVDRIQALETIILFERSGQVAQGAQGAISELHRDVRDLKRRVENGQ